LAPKRENPGYELGVAETLELVRRFVSEVDVPDPEPHETDTSDPTGVIRLKGQLQNALAGLAHTYSDREVCLVKAGRYNGSGCNLVVARQRDGGVTLLVTLGGGCALGWLFDFRGVFCGLTAQKPPP
jgi:hypothetical protein